MVRPIPCATGIVTVLVIGAFIVATGTPEYIHWSTDYTDTNLNKIQETHHIGPFRYCNDYEIVTRGYADTTCETIPRDCTVTYQRFIPDAIGVIQAQVFTTKIAKDCDGFNAFRGLLVMALLIGALSAIIQFAAGCYAFRPHLGTTTAILSGLCGMVSMAIIVALKNRKDEDKLHGNLLEFEIGSDYGYSFIIATAAWPLMLLMAFFFLFSASQS